MAPTTRKNKASNHISSTPTTQPIVRIARMNDTTDSSVSSGSYSDLAELGTQPAKRPRLIQPPTGSGRDQVGPYRSEESQAENNRISNVLTRTVGISEAKSILPDFDGENMPVTFFIKECLEIARLMNVSDGDLFTKFVRSEIIGKAKIYVNSRCNNNLQELLDTKRRAYFPQMDYYSLQAELSHIKQNHKETVSDYGLRVMLLLNKAIDIIFEEHDDDREAKSMINSATKNAIQCFLRGLQADITTFIFNKNFETLEQTIDEAVRLEQRLLARSKLFDAPIKKDSEEETVEYRQFVTPIPEVRRVRTVKNAGNKSTNEPRRCYTCNEPGHLARNCCNKPSTSNEAGNSVKFADRQEGRNSGNKSTRYNSNNNPNPMGGKAKNGDQSVKETRKCFQCDREGHIRRDCWKLRNCEYCKKPGHIESRCFTKLLRATMKDDNPTQSNPVKPTSEFEKVSSGN